MEIAVAAAWLAMLAVGCAAVLKLLNWRVFQEELASYPFLTSRLRTPVAVAVPAAEIAAVGLYAVPATRTAGALAGVALLCGFSLALAAVIRSGARNVRCACFGKAERVVTPALIARNAALAAPLVVIVPGDAATRAPGVAGWVGAALAGAVVWLALEFGAMRQIATAP